MISVLLLYFTVINLTTDVSDQNYFNSLFIDYKELQRSVKTWNWSKTVLCSEGDAVHVSG